MAATLGRISLRTTPLSRVCRRGVLCLALLCAVGGAVWADTGVAPPAGLLVTTCGDPTNDDQVSAADALMALQAAVGLEYCSVIYCDANGSGNTTALDALIILQAAVGLSVDLTCPLTAIVEILVTPTTGMLTTLGQQKTLSARALDERGEEIAADFTWHSSHPDQLSADQSGVATAVSLGSGQVWAEADGVESHRANFVVASPAAGAQLVTDSQVVGNIEPVDPASSLAVGFQYRVTLKDIDPPTVGQIMVGTGEAPVGGRVVAVETAGSDTIVTLEMVSISELFDEIALDDEFELTHAQAVVPEQVRSYYDSRANPDGSMTFTLKPRVARNVVMTRGQGRASGVCDTDWDPLGPYCCKFDTPMSNPSLSLNLTPTITLEEDISFPVALKADKSLSKLSLKADLKVEGKVDITFAFDLQATAECEIVLLEKAFPMPGPLGLVFGGAVRLGHGLAVGGKIPVAGLGFEPTVLAEVNGEVGIQCPASTCESFQAFTHKIEAGLKPKLSWAVDEGARMEAEAGFFGLAKLKVGAHTGLARWLSPALFSKLQIKLFKAKAGPMIKGKFATVKSQVFDTDYKSSHKLSFDVSLEAEQDLDNLLGFVKVNAGNLKITESYELGSSPTAALATTSRESYEPGDTVTFTVELDPENISFIPTFYNVKAVHIYQKLTATNSVELVASQAASPGQWQFGGKKSPVLAWSANKSGDIEGNFFAFVDASLLCVEECNNAVERYLSRLEMLPVEPGVTTSTTTTSTTTTTTTLHWALGCCPTLFGCGIPGMCDLDLSYDECSYKLCGSTAATAGGVLVCSCDCGPPFRECPGEQWGQWVCNIDHRGDPVCQ